MAELTYQERLQPSLLDRLTDDDPHNTKESRNARVMSMSKLRASVLRDLGWLLNTANFASHGPLAELPHVAKSTLNYGIPDFAGLTTGSIDAYELQRMLRQAICDFEPRIRASSLKVRVLAEAGEESSLNTLVFEIEGELWARPLPLELYLKTEVDLESGNVTMLDIS